MILEPIELGGFIVELEAWLFELNYYFGLLAILEGMGEAEGYPGKIIEKILEPARLLERYAEVGAGKSCASSSMATAA